MNVIALLGSAAVGAVSAVLVQVFLQERARHAQLMSLAAALARELLLMKRELETYLAGCKAEPAALANALGTPPHSLRDGFKSMFDASASSVGVLDRPILLTTIKAYWQHRELAYRLSRTSPNGISDQHWSDTIASIEEQKNYIDSTCKYLEEVATRSFSMRILQNAKELFKRPKINNKLATSI